MVRTRLKPFGASLFALGLLAFPAARASAQDAAGGTGAGEAVAEAVAGEDDDQEGADEDGR